MTSYPYEIGGIQGLINCELERLRKIVIFKNSKRKGYEIVGRSALRWEHEALALEGLYGSLRTEFDETTLRLFLSVYYHEEFDFEQSSFLHQITDDSLLGAWRAFYFLEEGQLRKRVGVVLKEVEKYCGYLFESNDYDEFNQWVEVVVETCLNYDNIDAFFSDYKSLLKDKFKVDVENLSSSYVSRLFFRSFYHIHCKATFLGKNDIALEIEGIVKKHLTLIEIDSVTNVLERKYIGEILGSSD